MVSVQNLAFGLLAVSILVGCLTWVYSGMRSGVRWWLAGYGLWGLAASLAIALTGPGLHFSRILGPFIVFGAWCHFIGARKVLGVPVRPWGLGIVAPLIGVLGMLAAPTEGHGPAAVFYFLCLVGLAIVFSDLLGRRGQIGRGQRWSVVFGWSALLALGVLCFVGSLAASLGQFGPMATGLLGLVDGALSLFILALCQNLLVIGLLSEEKAQTLRNAEDRRVQLSRVNHELKQFQSQILRTMVDLLECRIEESAAHVQRVAELTHDVLSALGYDADYCQAVAEASMLHDIGKVGVPDAVLKKPGVFTPEERRTMETHAALGGRLLAESDIPFFQVASRIATEHHEHWDGSGYPAGKRGEEISLEARIVAVADSFDALTRARPYKEAWPVEAAEAYLRDHSGTRFDPMVVETFLGLPPSRREPSVPG